MPHDNTIRDVQTLRGTDPLSIPAPPSDPIASFSSSRASVSLDALRGTAALLVVLGHLRNAFFVNLAQLTGHKALWFGVYAVTNLGHQAVLVFFVLSGYLVGGSVIRALRRRDWSWPRYLTHRLVRLWLVLIPALLLGLGWDQLGIYLHQAPALYSGHSVSHLTRDVGDGSTIGVLFANLAFLQSIYFPTFGSNGALWSLANEWWYYLLFPLAACVVARASRSWLITGAYVVLFALIGLMVGRSILALFPAWLLGAALHFAPKRTTALKGLALGGVTVLYFLAVCGFALLYYRGGKLAQLPLFHELCDNALGIVTAAFVWLLLTDRRAAGNRGWNVLARSGARCSYTMYVLHLPLIVFCAGVLVHDERWYPSAGHCLAALATLCAVLGYVWIVASLTEFRTDRVRSWIEGGLWPSSAAKVAPASAPLQ